MMSLSLHTTQTHFDSYLYSEEVIISISHHSVGKRQPHSCFKTIACHALKAIMLCSKFHSIVAVVRVLAGVVWSS